MAALTTTGVFGFLAAEIEFLERNQAELAVQGVPIVPQSSGGDLAR